MARALLCTERLSRTTICPGRRLGTSTRSTNASKTCRSTAPRTSRLSPMPPSVSVASHEMASRRPRGIRPTARWPGRARARSRVSVVGVLVSSRKTSRLGSIPLMAGTPRGSRSLVTLLGNQALFLRRRPRRRTTRLRCDGLRRMPVVASTRAACSGNVASGYASTTSAPRHSAPAAASAGGRSGDARQATRHGEHGAASDRRCSDRRETNGPLHPVTGRRQGPSPSARGSRPRGAEPCSIMPDWHYFRTPL